MNRGKRLFQCDECKTRRLISRAELSRRSKPKCRACGCSRLEIVSEEAKKELTDINTARVVQSEILERKRNGFL